MMVEYRAVVRLINYGVTLQSPVTVFDVDHQRNCEHRSFTEYQRTRDKPREIFLRNYDDFHRNTTRNQFVECPINARAQLTSFQIADHRDSTRFNFPIFNIIFCPPSCFSLAMVLNTQTPEFDKL